MGARRGSGQPRSAIPRATAQPSAQRTVSALPAPNMMQLQSRYREAGRRRGTHTGDTLQPAGSSGLGSARNLAERRGGPRSPQLHPAELPSLSLLFLLFLPPSRRGGAAAAPPAPLSPQGRRGGGRGGAVPLPLALLHAPGRCRTKSGGGGDQFLIPIDGEGEEGRREGGMEGGSEGGRRREG